MPPGARPRPPLVLAAALALVLSGGCAGEPSLSLEGAAPSPEALAREVPEAVAARDRRFLASLAVNGQEFRQAVWPELPSSRPERGLPVHYVWNDLRQKSGNSLSRMLNEYGGRRFTLTGVRYDGETTDYGTLRVHRKTRLTVREDTGKTLELRLYGSTMARNGEYKVFSYVVD
jgi:hypothetical protein